MDLYEANQELHQILEEEVAINRNNERRIRLLEKQLLQCENERYRKDVVIEGFDNEIQNLKDEISKLKRLLFQAHKENKDLNSYISKCEKVIDELEARIIKLENRIQELSHKRNTPTINNMVSLQTQIQTLQVEVDRLNQENELHIQEKAELQSELQDVMEKLNAENENLVNYLNDCENEINEKDEELLSLRSEVAKNFLECQRWKTWANELEVDNENLNDQCDMWIERYERMEYRHAIKTIKNYRLQRRLTNYQNEKAMANYWRKSLKRRYRKWKEKTKYERSEKQKLNINLQNNINPQNQNMAAIQDVTNAISPLLATIPKYKGQEPPDDYINNIEQVFVYGATLNVAGFDDAVKTQILQSKMSGKYLPVPAQHPAGQNIDTPARFRTWLRHKYHELTQGSQGASISKLATEKYLPNDTPESYEDRVRLLLLNTANNNADALALLWNHLPDELFNRVKSARPNANDIDAFFESVRNCYLERKPSTFTYSNNNVTATLSNIIANPTGLQQNVTLNQALDDLEMIAMRLGYPDGASRSLTAMRNFIEDEMDK